MDDIPAVDAASGSHQSPRTAMTAARALQDLLVRWLLGGERDRSDRAAPLAELPVVYPDEAVPGVLDSLATVVVATTESRQAQTCASLMRCFTDIVPRLHEDRDRAAFTRTLASVLPSVIQHAEIPDLATALARLETALSESGLDTEGLGEARRLLDEATRRLLPKASTEPEAAHPR